MTAAGRWLAGVLIAGFLAAAMLYLAPGATVDERELDPTLSEEARSTYRHQSPAHGSLLGFYAGFLNSAARGDLGVSRTYSIPVTRLLAERWKLTAVSVVQAWVAAWLLGLAAALISSGWRWAAPPFTVLSSILVCLPSGLLAVFFFVAGLPVSGILAAAVCPRVFQYLRNLLDRAARAPHCLAARARGVRPLRLLLLHRAWPIWPEAVTLAGVTVSTAIGAAIPAEALCDVPGLGQLAWKSALARDLPLLVPLTLVVAAVTLAVNSIASVAASGRTAAGPMRWRA
jgi:peptide/nickel transport system permease protein